MALPHPAPDRAALVTGASSGIGREIARELARRGHRLILVARRAEALEELAAELRTARASTGAPAGVPAGGIRVDVLPTDLSSPIERAALSDRIAALEVTVDILVNAAGMSTIGPIAGADPDAERHMIELDVLAVVELCNRLIPPMLEGGSGAVLNVASTGAFQPVPGQAGYGASKAFVLSFTSALAGELNGSGVTATTLCPGPVDTGFGATAGFSKADADAALPRMMWRSAEIVARAAVDGLAAGRLVVIPGVPNRVGAAFARLVPTGPLVRQLAKRHPGLRP